MSLINTYEFKECVNRYKSDRHAIKFTCRDRLQREMANLVILQMDKSASANKDILRNHPKCRVHTDLDSHL